MKIEFSLNAKAYYYIEELPQERVTDTLREIVSLIPQDNKEFICKINFVPSDTYNFLTDPKNYALSRTIVDFYIPYGDLPALEVAIGEEFRLSTIVHTSVYDKSRTISIITRNKDEGMEYLRNYVENFIEEAENKLNGKQLLGKKMNLYDENRKFICFMYTSLGYIGNYEEGKIKEVKDIKSNVIIKIGDIIKNRVIEKISVW